MEATIKNGQQPEPKGGLKELYWHQIFCRIYLAVVTTQKKLSSHGGFLTYTLHHQKTKQFISIKMLQKNKEKGS